MNEYIVKMTQTEVKALYTVTGQTPSNDEISSLAKIYYFIKDELDIYDDVSCIEHLFSSLIYCKI
jgi:hypothetical protein